ncbi:RbsD/FucU domain-containing protein [Corynebacterium casei]|uniref:RbsD/FucU domain-containing protein n=1 Tax=Corynebacterium casei TaxID=160386 RepID=UPI003FD1738C
MPLRTKWRHRKKRKLKNISPLASPALISALASVGHGDDITIAGAPLPTHGDPQARP